MENLRTAYARARISPLQKFDSQSARLACKTPTQNGRGAAVVAIETARKNLATFADARARYESTHAIRDAARVELADARAASACLAATSGPRFEYAAQRVTESVAALSTAERFADKARADVARARAAVSWYGNANHGPATWQGAARHMTAGDKGGQCFIDNDSAVVRNVRDAHDIARLGHTGWYDNPDNESWRDGSGLILGVVAQLRGRNGRAVFVPGWRMGDSCDGGVQYDMRAQFVADGSSESDAESAAHDCALRADGMAESVAESAREYNTAWRAGTLWADVLAILSERRAARSMVGALPALCDAIRGRVDSLLSERAELHAERARLADGDSEYGFYPDADARAAFCDGAELDSFPV